MAYGQGERPLRRQAVGLLTKKKLNPVVLYIVISLLSNYILSMYSTIRNRPIAPIVVHEATYNNTLIAFYAAPDSLSFQIASVRTALGKYGPLLWPTDHAEFIQAQFLKELVDRFIVVPEIKKFDEWMQDEMDVLQAKIFGVPPTEPVKQAASLAASCLPVLVSTPTVNVSPANVPTVASSSVATSTKTVADCDRDIKRLEAQLEIAKAERELARLREQYKNL